MTKHSYSLTLGNIFIILVTQTVIILTNKMEWTFFSTCWKWTLFIKKFLHDFNFYIIHSKLYKHNQKDIVKLTYRHGNHYTYKHKPRVVVLVGTVILSPWTKYCNICALVTKKNQNHHNILLLSNNPKWLMCKFKAVQILWNCICTEFVSHKDVWF